MLCVCELQRCECYDSSTINSRGVQRRQMRVSQDDNKMEDFW